MAFSGEKVLEGVLGGLSSKIADVATHFEALAGPLAKFVDALSPGTMQIFQLAMRDLYATIGSALLPVMQMLIEAVRKTSALLVPAVDALEPAFRSLAAGLLSFIMPAMQVLSHALKGMAPLMEAAGEALHILGDALGIVGVAFMSLKDAFGVFINGLMGGGGGGGGLKTMLDGLRDAVFKVMMVMITAAAAIAKAFGNTEFIKKFVENLKELQNPGEGGKGAALAGAGLKGLEQISKDLAVAATMAAGAGEHDKEDPMKKLTERMLKELEDVGENADDMLKWAKETYQIVTDKVTKVWREFNVSWGTIKIELMNLGNTIANAILNRGG